MVRYDDWLVLLLYRIAVFSCKHVDFPLVKAKLAHVSLQKENICTLHAGIQNVGGGHVVAFGAAHNLGALFDTRYVELPRNVNNQRPVFLCSFVDLVGSPQELHVCKVHPSGFPNLDEVAPNCSNFVKISVHFII